jgi:general stress protein YciG
MAEEKKTRKLNHPPFTKENAAEIGRNGGIKSGEVRRKKREIREAAKTLMALSLKRGEIDDIDCLEEAKGKNMTGAEAMFLQQMLKAMKGDSKAAEFCFKYAGLEPAKELEINADVNHTDEITNILDILADYKENGGKYSGKNKKEDN